MTFKIYLPLFLCFWLVACTQASTSSVRFGLAEAPVNLDPRFATDATSSRINRLIYRSLIGFDQHYAPTPELATWEQVSLTHYKLHLGEMGRNFHDGSRLQAEDVKATYNFILDPRNASPHRTSLAHIQEVRTLDQDNVEFHLSKPDALFIGRLTIGIVPAKLIKQHHPFNTQPLGSGYFRFVQWSQSNRLILQRITDGLHVEFLEVKDPLVRVLKLAHGELDMLQNDLSPELITWLARQPQLRISKREGTNFAYIGLNLEDKVTANLLVREAISHAINREEIIRYVLGDAAHPANSLLPTAHWARHPDLPPYRYDPEKAKQLLQQAGVSLPLHLTYKTTNNPLRLRLATVIQHQLSQVGIQAELRSYDWGTFYGDIKTGNFQMFSLAWIGIKLPDIFRYAFHSDAMPPKGANRGRFKDARVDELIEKAELAPTLDAQAAFYREVQQRLFEQLPCIPLWYEDLVLIAQKNITGYELAADGNYDGLNTVQLIKM